MGPKGDRHIGRSHEGSSWSRAKDQEFRTSDKSNGELPGFGLLVGVAADEWDGDFTNAVASSMRSYWEERRRI